MAEVEKTQKMTGNAEEEPCGELENNTLYWVWKRLTTTVIQYIFPDLLKQSGGTR